MRLSIRASLSGVLTLSALVGCGARTELELDPIQERHLDASVERDAVSVVDGTPFDMGVEATRDVSAEDGFREADVELHDASIEQDAVDATLEAGKDASDARDAAVADAARDAPPEARTDAADAPLEGRDAEPDATVDETGTEAGVDASPDTSACDEGQLPGRRFAIGVVEAPTNSPYMLPDGGSIDAIDDCSNRFVSVFGAYADVERVPLAAIDDRLPRYDLVVLCSDWAERDLDSISPHAPAFTRYVTAGGGLLMYQPNKTTRVDLLPAWYDVDFRYTDTSASIVADHPVTCGLSSSDVPYPADRITDFAPEWTALVRGDESGDASLLVTELGKGRASVDSGHNSKLALRPESDRFLERLGRWLMKILH